MTAEETGTPTLAGPRARTGAVAREEIAPFVAAWFHQLDVHAPLDDFLRFLAEEGLRMSFPGTEIADAAGFAAWHRSVTHLFFDQTHNPTITGVTIEGDTAVIDLVVGWQASWYEPPDARSKRTAVDATQRWTIRRSSKNPWGLEIVTYDATFEPFKYAPGSARL